MKTKTDRPASTIFVWYKYKHMKVSNLRIDYDWSVPPSHIRTIVDVLPPNSYIDVDLVVTMGKAVILTLRDITYDECVKQIETYHEAYAHRLNRRYEN